MVITDGELASEFLDFFDEKISRIVCFFDNSCTGIVVGERASEQRLSSFRKVDPPTISNIIKEMKLTHCANDPLPIKLVTNSRNFLNVVDTVTKMVNTSISVGCFPSSEKRAIIRPVIKGKLDPHTLSSYRPVSNLTVQSKILEKVLLSQ